MQYLSLLTFLLLSSLATPVLASDKSSVPETFPKEMLGGSRPEEKAHAFKLANRVWIVRLRDPRTQQVTRTETTRRLVTSQCPECFTRDAMTYYDSWVSYVFDGASYDRSFAQKNIDAAYACADKAPVGATVRANYTKRTLCKKGKAGSDYHKKTKVRYTISRRSDGIHLSFRLRLNIIDDKISNTHAGKMLARARDCIPFVRTLWAQYGIHFALELDSNRHIRFADKEIDHSAYYWDMHGTSSSGTLYTKARDGQPDGLIYSLIHSESAELRKFCATFEHELGHMLGLHDEYIDLERCPDRPYVSTETNPVSFMADHTAAPLEQVGFYPRHITQVVSPLCGGVGTIPSAGRRGD